jgi:hypothetical protein
MLRTFSLLGVVPAFCGTVCFGQNGARFDAIKPGMYDEQLVQQALKIANQRAVNMRCPERYIKGVILSYQWHNVVDREGFVTGRKIHVELYCERPGEMCGMADFTFLERYVAAGAFSDRLVFVRNGNTYAVDCE